MDHSHLEQLITSSVESVTLLSALQTGSPSDMPRAGDISSRGELEVSAEQCYAMDVK